MQLKISPHICANSFVTSLLLKLDQVSLGEKGEQKLFQKKNCYRTERRILYGLWQE